MLLTRCCSNSAQQEVEILDDSTMQVLDHHVKRAHISTGKAGGEDNVDSQSTDLETDSLDAHSSADSQLTSSDRFIPPHGTSVQARTDFNLQLGTAGLAREGPISTCSLGPLTTGRLLNVQRAAAQVALGQAGGPRSQAALSTKTREEPISIFPLGPPATGPLLSAPYAADQITLGQTDAPNSEVAISTPEWADWYGIADTASVKGLEGSPITRLLSADIIRHGDQSLANGVPWLPGESQEIYTRLGVNDPEKSYVSLWLNFKDASMLTVSEVLDRQRLEFCLAEDCLAQRLKLLICPVKCGLPFPSKGAPDAEFVRGFFGHGASCSRTSTVRGVDHICLQVDLFSKWIVRLALQSIGLRPGNIVDIVIVDWPGRAALTACRLNVTDTFVRLMGR